MVNKQAGSKPGKTASSKAGNNVLPIVNPPPGAVPPPVDGYPPAQGDPAIPDQDAVSAPANLANERNNTMLGLRKRTPYTGLQKEAARLL